MRLRGTTPHTGSPDGEMKSCVYGYGSHQMLRGRMWKELYSRWGENALAENNIYNISTSEEHLSRLCSTIFSVYIILGKCKHAWASCMHFSYWGENQVSNLMSISEVTIVVESLHCWHQSSFVRHRLSCQLNYSTVLSKCHLLLFTFVICTFNAFSASLHVH